MRFSRDAMARGATALLSCSLVAACHGAAIPAGSAPSEAVQSAAAVGPHKAMLSERAMPFKVVGSGNTVTADMPVPRPDTSPCTVTLFSHLAFENFSPQTFSYTPPSSCPRPWAKVVLNFNVSTSKGVQFDRTAIIWVGGAVAFFGTTAEPSPQLAPRWHTERDVTDLSAIFGSANQGQISLGNCYCPPNYTGILYGTAYLQFYPPDAKYPALPVPDKVIGIPYAPPLGNVAQLPQTTMAIATPLPHNIVNVSMDLYLQSQSDEEQWFMCAPHSVWYQSKHELGFCGHTAFREGVVTVDGRPAGIAPIYPWIYTGGMDPYLWAPIPGVQTLNFTPYRVDLTPFAGYLSTTATPTIAVTVQGAFHYFSGAGDLLLYLDPKRSQVTGSVTSDSLTIPSPPGTSGITYAAGSGLFGGKPAAGPAHVRAHQAFLIDGYVNTSSGKVETSVYQEMRFANDEAFVYTPTSYVQDVTQSMTLHSQVKTIAGKTSAVEDSEYEYPIDVAYPITQTTTGYQLPITVYQGDYVRHAYCCAGPLRGNAAARRFASNSVLNDTVESADTMIFDSAFNWTGVANGSSSQLYTYRDSSGTCYGREITSKNNVVASDHPTACTKPSPTPPPTPAPSRRR